jgi:hypothetical protein
MNFREYDAAPSDALNRILWHTAKGWDTPYPVAPRSLFFPLAVDLADEEREADEAGEPAVPGPERWADDASDREAVRDR